MSENDKFETGFTQYFFEASVEDMSTLLGEFKRSRVGIEEVERYFGQQKDADRSKKGLKLSYKGQFQNPEPIKFEIFSFFEGEEPDPEEMLTWLLYIEKGKDLEPLLMYFYWYAQMVDDHPFYIYSHQNLSEA